MSTRVPGRGSGDPDRTLRRSDPLSEIDDVVLDRVFQPLIDRSGFDPRRTSVVMLIVHVMAMAALHAGASTMEASGIPVMSHLETFVVLPAFGVLQAGFLWMNMRNPAFMGCLGLDALVRVMYLSFAILTAAIVPRAIFGEAVVELLDRAGRTPFALREIAVSFAASLAAAAAALYFAACRRPPPRRRPAWT